MDSNQFWSINLQLLQGFGNTCLLFAVTLVVSLPLGLLICFGSMSCWKPLWVAMRLFIWVIRGTPLMLQVMIVFYLPGLAFGMPMENRMAAVLVAFIINYAAYFSEIYRGGIEAIPKGQYEAGQVLGLSDSQIFFKIIALQVVKKILPSLSNEVITLVKDTSLARVIAVAELIRVAQDIVAQQAIIWPLFYTGIFYLIMNGLITLGFSLLEKRLGYFKG